MPLNLLLAFLYRAFRRIAANFQSRTPYLESCADIPPVHLSVEINVVIMAACVPST